MADTHETIAERLGIPDHIEFRGYEYTIHSIHRCVTKHGVWLAHSDNPEDNARIEAGHIRYDGGRACVKRFKDAKFGPSEDVWVVYWR